MKKYIALFCSVMALGLASCTDSFDQWNTNPVEVTPGQMQQDNLATGSNYATMQRGIFTVGKDNGGTYQISQMLTGDIFAGYFADLKGTYNIGNRHYDHYVYVSHWNDYAFNEAYTRIMEPYRQICSFSEEGSVDRALGLVLRVYGMSRITDKYGPIIYSKFGTAMQAGYDSQKDVYTQFFADLDEALATLDNYVELNPGATYMARYDNVYSGDVSKWIKFANSLRLRLAMRVSYADQNLAKTEAQKAIAGGLMTSAADDAVLHQSSNLTFTNSLWEVTQSWADLGMSATADCYLNGYNDPRLPKMYKANTDGTYRGARNGVNNPAQATLLPKVSAANFDQFANQPWMNAAETYFLLAEAKLRLGIGDGTVKDLYEQGVRTSFESWGVSGADSYLQSEDVPATSWTNPTNERSVNVGSMLSFVAPKFDESGSTEAQLEQIMTQKWIALYPDGQEAWSEMRRTGYPGWVLIDNYGYQSEVQNGDIIRRLHFPSTEYSNNAPNMGEAVRLLGAGDICGTHLWWDCK